MIKGCFGSTKSDIAISGTPTGAVVERRASESSLTGSKRQMRRSGSRGVDTRIRKLDEGQYDALILAAAGLRRLGLQSRISFAIPTDEMLPAVGQGAIAVETRSEDEFAIAALRKLDHAGTRVACLAERSLLRSLGGGCQFPIAAHGVFISEKLRLDALVATPDGSRILRGSVTGVATQPEELGQLLASQLQEAGADNYEEFFQRCGRLLSSLVLHHSFDYQRMKATARDHCPTIEIKEPESYQQLDEAIDHLYGYDWLIFTSANAVEFFLKRLAHQNKQVSDLDAIRVCAIGVATAEKLHDAHVHVDLVPSDSRSEGVFSALSEFLGSTEQLSGVNLLLPRAATGRDVLPKALEEAGARVDIVTAYRTVTPDNVDRGRLSALLAGSADCIAFTSSSTVKNLAQLFDTHDLSTILKRIAVACIGDVTAATASEYGLAVNIQPATSTVSDLARAIADYYAG